MMRNAGFLGFVVMGAALFLAVAGCDREPVASSPETPEFVPPAESLLSDVMLPDQSSKKGKVQSIVGTIVQLVGPAGGKIKNGPIELDIPEGALDEWMLITVSLPAGGPLYGVFGPDGLEFNVPVTLSVDLDEVIVIGDEANLTWYWLDPATLSWVDIGATLEPTEHKLETEITHFSIYQPGGRAGW